MTILFAFGLIFCLATFLLTKLIGLLKIWPISVSLGINKFEGKVRKLSIDIYEGYVSFAAMCLGLFSFFYFFNTMFWTCAYMTMFALDAFFDPEGMLRYHETVEPVRPYLIASANIGIFFWTWWPVFLVIAILAIAL